MVRVETLRECCVCPMLRSCIRRQLTLRLLSRLLSIRQSDGEGYLTTKANRLNSWPQLLLIADAAPIEPRMCGLMYNYCGNRLRACRLGPHILHVERASLKFSVKSPERARKISDPYAFKVPN